jgi:hypothetical protein
VTSRPAAAQHLRDPARLRRVRDDDPDGSLAFYRDRPEVVPVVLLLCGLGPVKTNGQRRNRHPGAFGLSISGLPVRL